MNKFLFLLLAVVLLVGSEMAFGDDGEVGKVVSIKKLYPAGYEIVIGTESGPSVWQYYPPEIPNWGKDLRIVYLLNFAMANKDSYDVYVNYIYQSSGGTKYIAYCQLVRDVKPLQDKIAALEAKVSYLMKKINKCCK